MGLLEKLRAEFIDIVEWTEPSQSETLAYRFPRYNNEIKYGARLTVREGQAAVFVNEGQLADVFSPGMYTLETRNLPILSTLMGWKYGFSSPFKAEIYFVSTRQWTDQKWGTQNPVILRDPEFGPIRVRAYGTYAFRVTDPGAFLRQLVATEPDFEVYDISNQLRNTIVSRFSDVMGQAKIPIVDLAGNYERISQIALGKIGPDLDKMGLSLTLFYTENISLPPEVEQALDKRAQMGIVGDMSRFTQYQAAEAIRDAANNPGGMAGIGAGLGAGIGVANHMVGAMSASSPLAATSAPPPVPSSAPAFYVAFNHTQTGPFDFATLSSKVRDGSLTRTTLVWKAGMPNWLAAEAVEELKPLFGAVPLALPTK
jgi:membrane protease subunit (stomatin/prohibitin family)